jgi:DNA repair exonuclease SbcCD ATPase subunit
MNDDTQLLPDMTLEEAQEKHAELKALETVMRSRLLEMRDRKGWKVLGYSSFSEYGEKEWGYTQSYISRLANAAEIQKHLNMPIGINDIPESHLRPLSKVSDADKSSVYEEAVERALAEGKKLGAKMMEEVVADYIAKNSQMQKRLDFLELDKEATHKQNDELRNALAHQVNTKVDEKLAIERATLILENSQALQNAQKLIDDAQDTIERLQQESADQLERFKKEKDKAIRDGISLELSKRETELRQLDYQVESLEKQAAELRQARDLLDSENGVIKQHQESIKDVSGAIQDIKAALYLAKESGRIPIELMNAWYSLSEAFSELANELQAFCGRDSVVIDGNALSSDSSNHSFNVWGNA